MGLSQGSHRVEGEEDTGWDRLSYKAPESRGQVLVWTGGEGKGRKPQGLPRGPPQGGWWKGPKA